MRVRPALAALAAAAALTAGLVQPAAHAATPTVHTAAAHTPRAVTHGHVTAVRKATAADVASGFAASTASSVRTCQGHTQMDNPYTGKSSVYLQMYVAWQESKDALGTPDARINNTTAIVLHNESNRGTTPVFFNNATWNSPAAGNYQIVENLVGWYSGSRAIVKGGQQVGMQVLADGNVNPYVGTNDELWKNSFHYGWGFRQFLAYAPHANAFPRLYAVLSKGDGTGDQSSDIRIYADGNCGDLILY